ncbi:hypothetical protein [Hyphobacterium sp.]|uniref:hypothetical protein n=1 Tax=Hyphobacterium sp. TaxID=2004662 RepID=UPI003B520E7B
MMRCIAAIFIVFLLAPTARAQNESWSVPTEMCRDYFFVPIVVSAQPGRPEDESGRTLWMLYDTGAAATFVDPDSIERVANMRVRDQRRINITNARMGPVSVNRMPARITDLDHLTVGLGREIDGILAVDAFQGFLLTLDYEHGALRLTRGALPRPDNDSVFSTRGPGKRPFLTVDIAGRTRRILIDSGAASAPLAVNRLDRYALTEPARPIGASIRFSHIEYREGGRLDGAARFGPFVLDAPLMEEVPETELLGGMIMRHFNWTFDLENERVRIERIIGEGPIMLPPETTHGLALRPEGGALVVQAILPGSLAGEAGLAEGDILTHFDGRPVADRGCQRSDADDTPLSLTVTRVRDGESVDVVVPLVRLVD